MRCRHAQKMLADYANDVLEVEDSRLVQEHVANCETCQRELGVLRKVLRLIDDTKVEYPPASVWQNFIPDLHRRIETEAALAFRKQRRQRLYLSPGWAAIAAIVMLLSAFTILWNNPLLKPVQVQEAAKTETSEDIPPSEAENSSESVLVAGVISRVLITEAEAAELRKAVGSIQPETPTFLPYYYHYDEDVLTDTSGDLSATVDDEEVIQYLENEFAEFNENPMVESDDSGLGAI